MMAKEKIALVVFEKQCYMGFLPIQGEASEVGLVPLTEVIISQLLSRKSNIVRKQGVRLVSCDLILV